MSPPPRRPRDMPTLFALAEDVIACFDARDRGRVTGREADRRRAADLEANLINKCTTVVSYTLALARGESGVRVGEIPRREEAS